MKYALAALVLLIAISSPALAEPPTVDNTQAAIQSLQVPNIPQKQRFGATASHVTYNEAGAVGAGAGVRLNETFQIGGAVSTAYTGENLATRVTLTASW
jgi:hypothetical protein